jgi:branched-chain amino acid transport system ATP-binding protein
MNPALQVDGVTKAFGALVAVRDVSLTVQPGERRAILGTNGAGKTTLFNVIAGDFLPTHGSLRLFGTGVTHLPAYRRTRLGISRTYQASRVLSGLSVLDNLYLAVRGVERHRFSLRLPRPDDAYRVRSREFAAKVGLSDRTELMASELSHGEQRQLEIGMALAGKPRLLLLDEPAAGLSPLERPVLSTMLRALPHDVTVILIEHDMDVALQVADRVSVMHEGSVVFEGSPAETAASELVQSIYLGKKARQHAASGQGA